VIELGRRAQRLPAPPGIVWGSLHDPRSPKGGRPWLRLERGEVEPRVLESEEPHRLVWSSLWPERPRDVVVFEIEPQETGSSLRFTLLTPDEPPEAGRIGHLRRRLNVMLFADLRFSYGQ
jgi:uncharacterized protein YndB with AHSA1/START domain